MSITVKTTEQAIRLLQACKAEFKIILPTGEEFGTLEVVKKAEHKRTQRYPRGFLHDLYLPVLEPLPPGEVGVVLCPDAVDPTHMQSAICGWCSNRWGAGTYRSCVNGQSVEVLRIE